MIERKNPPAFHPVSQVEFMKPVQRTTPGNIPVWIFHQPGCGVVRLEIFYRAGEKYGAPVIVRALSSLMPEGAGKLNAHEMAARFDTFGATVQVDADKDHLCLTIYALTENALELAQHIKSILTEPRFDDDQRELYIARSVQRLRVNRQKVDVLAREKLAEAIYGPDSVHGKRIDEPDLSSLDRNSLTGYFEKYIRHAAFEVVMSGDCPDDFVDAWMQTFDSIPGKNHPAETALKAVFTAGRYKAEKKDAVQNAIVLACPVINRHHPDFPALQMVNLILGGYFGSRLMSNIREDKGYTYGIGSGVRITNDIAYLGISTEVGSDVCSAALQEIYKEISRLCHEKVGEDELELARQYMLGSFLRNSDGSLAMADRFKSIHFSGLGYDYYDRYLRVIHEIEPQKIMETAQTWLGHDQWIEITAGQ